MYRKSLRYGWLFLRSCCCYAATFLLAVTLFIPLLLVLACLPQRWRYRSKIVFTLLYLIYAGMRRTCLLQVTSTGEQIPRTEPVIIVANHASSLDIPLLGMLVGTHPHLWYALKRFFSTPVLGFLLRRMALPIDPDRPVWSARSLIKGISVAREYALHSLIFPEGGRFLDGGIHPFFPGFALLARKLQQPVVPVMMKGVGKVYPPRSILFYPAPITLIVGPPLRCGEYETDEQFVQRVRQWFIDQNS